MKIVSLLLTELEDTLKERGISLSVTDDAKEKSLKSATTPLSEHARSEEPSKN